MRRLPTLALAIGIVSLIGCQNQTPEEGLQKSRLKDKISAYPIQIKDGKKVRIIPAADYLMFPELPVPPTPKTEGTSILVDLQNQRSWLYQNGKHLLTAPISPGGPNKKSPTGNFEVISRHEDWVSTTYHTPMPYFLRLNADQGQVGIHAGIMTLKPGSHGCIRLPKDMAKAFFENSPVGTKVKIF